jgi:hypothetical protein
MDSRIQKNFELSALHNDIANKEPHTLTQSELDRHAGFVKQHFPAPRHLSIDIIDKLINQPQFDITKNERQNWVRDYQLLFCISKLKNNILVTGDKAMLAATKFAGLEAKTMKLADYKAFIGF